MRRFALFSLAVALTLLLIGCGGEPPKPRVVEKPELELRSTVINSTEGQYAVTGAVRNVTGRGFANVQVVVTVLDSAHRPAVAYIAAIDASPLYPDTITTWQVSTETDPAQYGFEVGFKERNGGPIPHRDARQQQPSPSAPAP